MDSRELVSKACEAMKSAYTPYSGFKVVIFSSSLNFT